MRGRWYGDYPYRTDRRLRIPRWIYRLEQRAPLHAQVDELRWEGERLHISGYAFIRGHRRPTARARSASRSSRSAAGACAACAWR